MRFLLRLFSKEMLWKEVISREGFTVADQIESVSIWQQVYYRTPELRDYFRRREITLLKASTLQEKPPEFILGQIAENRLWQRFDVPGGASPKVDAVEQVTKKLPTVSEFLGRWMGKKNEPTNEVAGKQSGDQESVSGGEE